MRQEIKTMLVTCDGCRTQHEMVGLAHSRFTPDGWREMERCGYGDYDGHCRRVLLCGECAKKEAS